MKSPSPFVAAGFCLGVRWQGQGVAVLSQRQCWDSAGAFALLGEGWFSVEFVGFADSLIGSIKCHLFILVRGEVSCFSWSVWY